MSLANELRACLNEILRAPVPVPEPAEPDDPVRFFKHGLPSATSASSRSRTPRRLTGRDSGSPWSTTTMARTPW